MKEKVHLRIEKPCQASWAGMNEVDSGRFCNNCSKVVYDVSKWDNDKIEAAYEAADGQLCVRIPTSRLDQPLRRPGFKQILLALAISLMLFFSRIPKTFAQIAEVSRNGNPQQGLKRHLLVKGCVFDSSQQLVAIPYASLFLYEGGEMIGTAFSDSLGSFSFADVHPTTDSLPITIECSHNTYKTVTSSVQGNEPLEIDFFMKESTFGLRTVKVAGATRSISLGAVTMGSVVRVKRSHFMDWYDTKTYRQEDLQRYNFNRP